MRKSSCLVIGALALLVVSGCSSSSKTTSTTSTVSTPPTTPLASTLTVTQVAEPALGAPFPATLKATYPQVHSPSVDLTKVNAVLRSVSIADEQQFAHGEPVPCTGAICTKGSYTASPEVTVASVQVVSVLTSIQGFYPGAAHPNQHWLAINVEVPSGKRIALADLFQNPIAALKLIAPVVRTNLKDDRCIAPSWQGTPATAFPTGIGPTPQNYSSLALTPAGLDVGFDQGQIAAEACGSREVIVPWSVVQSSLTTLGAQWVAAATNAPTN